MRNPLPRAMNQTLSLLGLQRRRNPASYLLPMVGLGMLAGAGLALMFARRKGVETRADLANRGRDLGSRVAEVATTVARKIKHTAKGATSDLDDALSEIRAYSSAAFSSNGVSRDIVNPR